MTYRKRLFLYFLVVFLAFIAVDIAMQVNREKRYKTEIVRKNLQVYAEIAEEYGKTGKSMDSVLTLFPPSLRLTLIDNQGRVLYDNVIADIPKASNHAERPEVTSARIKGAGSAIRKSESTEEDYLYFAKQIRDGSFIRTALPYPVTFHDFLGKENIWMYTIILLFAATLFIILFLTDKYSRVMTSLKKFVTSAEQNNPDYESIRFPNTDSGEIGAKVISIYKQLEESKRQIDIEKDRNRQMKQEMTNNIAHELKTPISSIMGYTETLLGDKPMNPEEQRYFLERTYSQACRLSELIHDIALITKMEETPHYFLLEKINVRDVSEEAANELKSKVNEAGAKIFNRIPHDTEIAGNHNLIYSIFRNLIDNALVHAGPGIHIVMECTDDNPESYSFIFYDTGKGIREEYLERIFDRFLRIDEGRTRRDGGTGLGLSIVKHAVIMHGGEIVAKNRETGGLEFHFSIQKKGN